MKKLFTILILLFTYYLLATASVNAQGTSLGIYPPILEIETTPPSEIKSKLSIENPTNQSIEVSIQIKPFKASASNDGQVEILETFDAFPDPLLVNRVKIMDNGVAVKSLSLAPKQEKELEIEISIPPNEAAGDYYFTILFVTKPMSEITTNSSLAAAGVATNVLLTVGPKGKTKGFIEKFSAPFLVDSGPVPFTVQVQNQSSHFVSVSGEITIENIFGQKVGSVKLLPVNVLGESQRLVPDEKQKNPDSDDYKKIEKTILSANYPVAVWPEKFLIGPYKATLTLSFGEDSEKFVRSVSFFAFPATYLIAILTVLGIVSFIVFRVKRKMN
jgi:hypothetical protein